jgi:hypothetical protein
MKRLAVGTLSSLVLALSLSIPFAATSLAANGTLQATFVDIYSQCPTSPPTNVFCGDGNVVGYGAAHSTAALAGPLVPLGGGCFALTAVRTITLLDGSGSLTMHETGAKCAPSEAAFQNAQGVPYTVAKTYAITGGTGVFAGAIGSGSDVNRSAGNSQVSVISGTIAFAS